MLEHHPSAREKLDTCEVCLYYRNTFIRGRIPDRDYTGKIKIVQDIYIILYKVSNWISETRLIVIGI